MGQSKKTSQENSTQTRNPYLPAQGGIDTILGDSLKTYQSGVGSQVYQGPRVAGFSDPTQAGLGFLQGNASAGQGAAQAGDTFLQRLLGRGGATDATTSAMQGIQGVGTADTSGIAGAAGRMSDPNNATAAAGRALTGGAFNLDATGYNDLNAGLSGPSQTQQSLQDAASGKFLAQGGNPYLDAVVGRTNADALNAVKNSFSASGRYGSGMFGAAAADAISRNEGNLRYTDYNTERDRQVQAASAIDQQSLARSQARQGLYGASNDTRTANANQLAAGANLQAQAQKDALTGQQSLFNANSQNAQQQFQQFVAQLQGAQSDRAAAQSGLGQVSGVQSSLLQPGKTLLGAGSLQDQQNQAQLDAAQQKFADEQSSPWKQLGLLEQTNLPIASGFGSQTGQGTRTDTSSPGLLNSLLGGITGITGGLTNLGKAAPALSQFGSSVGSGLGSVLSLFSDERVKEDIEQVGETHDGQPIYRFRYKGDPTVHMGLIAQEVGEKHPEAVSEGPGGVLAVDYGAATEDAARKGQGRRAPDRDRSDLRVSPRMLRDLLGAAGAAM